jgi:hypothetical protein
MAKKGIVASLTCSDPSSHHWFTYAILVPSLYIISDGNTQKCHLVCLGCGRKRSSDSVVGDDWSREEADLNRQLLTEGRLWQALQQAAQQLYYSHHQVVVRLLVFILINSPTSYIMMIKIKDSFSTNKTID